MTSAMRMLGRKYLATLATGVAGAILAVVGAVAGLAVLSVTGLALALVGVLGTLVWHRLDLQRLRSQLTKASRSAAAASAPGPDTSPRLADQVRMQQQIAAQIEQGTASTIEVVEKIITDQVHASYAQTAALLQLMAFHSSQPAVRLRDTDLLPGQILDLISAVRRLGPRRVLASDLGPAGAVWLGHALAEQGACLSSVVADSTDVDGLERVLEEHELSSTVRVCRAPSVVPETPHAYLSWHDLSRIDEGASFDLVVIVVPDETAVRATLPVLPLVEQRLESAGAVAVVEADPDRAVSRAWAAAPRWSADTTDTTITLLQRCI